MAAGPGQSWLREGEESALVAALEEVWFGVEDGEVVDVVAKFGWEV